MKAFEVKREDVATIADLIAFQKAGLAPKWEPLFDKGC
jgi:hypothetical protein